LQRVHQRGAAYRYRDCVGPLPLRQHYDVIVFCGLINCPQSIVFLSQEALGVRLINLSYARLRASMSSALIAAAQASCNSAATRLTSNGSRPVSTVLSTGAGLGLCRLLHGRLRRRIGLHRGGHRHVAAGRPGCWPPSNVGELLLESTRRKPRPFLRRSD
jgi:hypothetical protein